MSLRIGLAGLVAAMMLAGCGGVAPGPELPSIGAARSSAASTGTLALGPGGLIETQSGLRIDFGRTQESTLPPVTRLLGTPPSSVEQNSECGAGPLTIARWPGAGLELVFQDGDFRGWVGTGRALRTAGGLQIGADRETITARGGDLRPSSLGDEFTLSGISGLFDDRRVTTLWAGTTCFFR